MDRAGVRVVLAAGAVLAVATGCGGSPSATGGAHPTTSASRSASSPTAPRSTASPTPSPPPPPSPTPATAADLDDAALVLDELPAGFSVDKASSFPALAASAKDPDCSDLVRVINATASPGALATRTYDYDGGVDGGYLRERLDALASSGAGTDSMVTERVAVHTCSQVTMYVPDYGRADFAVSEISFPDTGYGWAVRLSAVTKAVEGTELVLAGSATDGVAVHLLADDDAEEAQQVMQNAMAKVHDRFAVPGHPA